MNTITRRKSLSAYLTVSIILAATVPLLGANSSGSQSTVSAEARQKLAKLQIPFIANQGQSDKEMKFYARTFAGTVFVTETGKLLYSLPKVEEKEQVNGVVLKEELIGGKVTEVKGESQAVTKLNYFKGNDRSKWQSNIPSYDIVSLGEVYEGIDVKLKAYGNNVEKLFYVKPGGNPETIKIKLSGGKGTRINQDGELEVETGEGTVRFSKPVAFQESEGKKEFVEAAYVVRGNEYGFEVEDYDRTRELVIDPILGATFLGGSGHDSVSALAFDSTGNVYVAGFTGASDFPGIGPGSADSTFSGEVEGFVAKLNSDLSSILAATFLGLSGREAFALVLDGTGNVYVAGSPFFVAKLNSDLSSVLAATSLGGNVSSPLALALDSTGNVYVTGDAVSSDFPGIGAGSADSTFAGDREGFVVKLNSDLSSVLAATFLGGSGSDEVSALALDSSGNVYVAGHTTSSDFPGIGAGSADSTFAGDFEGFVAKLNSDLSSILAATFLGGSAGDEARALTLDSTGNVFVAGVTSSSDFPGVGPGSADSTFAGGEGFVVKLNSDLNSILAATFLGGSGFDSPNSLALDRTGNVYVAGQTGSSDFPGVGPGSADNTFAGDLEGFVAKLDANLSSGGLQIVNDKVNFVVQSTSFNPASVPGGPAGTFVIIALLTNKSAEIIREPIKAIVKTLTNGNKLLSATEGDGGVGSKQAIGAGPDDTLTPNESVTVQFRIGLANHNRFDFFVDVLGVVSDGE